MTRTHRRARTLAAAAAALLPYSAPADTRTYTGPATSTFSTPSNWSPVGVPTPADDALISPAAPTSAYSITFNTSAPYQLNSLTLNSPAPTKPLTFNLYPTLVTSSAQVTASSEVVGSTGDATLVQTNQLNLVSTLSIADSPNSSGTYRLLGGLLTADTAYVGRAGAGTFSLTAGSLAATNLYLAASPGSSANFAQTGGSNSSTNVYLAAATGSFASYSISSSAFLVSLTPASLYVGYAGAATFSQSGSTVGRQTFSTAGSTSLLLGYSPASSGTYALSDGYLYDSLAYVGFSGTGSFVQTGGYHSVSATPSGTVANLYIGYNPASTGTYALSGGTLSTPSLYVGYSGTGSFTQSGTGHVSLTQTADASTGIFLGYNPGSVGSYSLATALTENSAYVGFAGAGTFAQTAGLHTINDSLFVAYAPGSTGLYSLAAGSLHASTLFVGYNGAGTFSQSGGFVSATNGIFIGNNASPSSSYLLAGNATLANSATLSVGYGAPGTFVQSGGTVTGAGSLYVGNGAHASYSLSGDYLSASTEYVGARAGHGTFTQTGGTNAANILAVADFVPGYTDFGSYALAAGSLALNYEYLGYYGQATFTQTGGIHSVVNGLFLGFNSYSNAHALFNLSAGTLTAASETIGYNATTPSGTFLQTGGSNTTTTLITNAGLYSLAGGTLTINGPLPAPNASFLWSWTAGSLNLNSGYSLSTNHAVSSPISSPLTLTAIQTLSTSNAGTNPVAGNLTLAGGTLAGTGSFTNAGEFTLAGGVIAGPGPFTNTGTLSGYGTITNGPFTNAGSLTLTAGGPNTFSAPLTNTATLSLQNTPVAFPQIVTNTGSISLINSSATFPAALVGTSGSLTLDSTSSLTAQYLIQATVSSAGSITLLSPTPFSTIGSLTLAPTAILDVTQNTLAINNTPLDTVRQYLGTGQLRSSAADPAHTLTYYTYLNSPNTTTLTIQLTGDANFDRKLDSDDYALLDRSFAQNLPDAHWTDGDFNFDGIIDSHDYLLLDTAYLSTHPGEATTLLPQRESQFGPAYVTTLLTSVPEPTSLLAACGLAVPTLRRRRFPRKS